MRLRFLPIAELPDDYVDDVLVRGGEEISGYKARPYMVHAAWRDSDGKFWIGRGCEIEIDGPTEFAFIPRM